MSHFTKKVIVPLFVSVATFSWMYVLYSTKCSFQIMPNIGTHDGQTTMLLFLQQQ